MPCFGSRHFIKLSLASRLAGASNHASPEPVLMRNPRDHFTMRNVLAGKVWKEVVSPASVGGGRQQTGSDEVITLITF
jgi:hypothetical protein